MGAGHPACAGECAVFAGICGGVVEIFQEENRR